MNLLGSVSGMQKMDPAILSSINMKMQKLLEVRSIHVGLDNQNDETGGRVEATEVIQMKSQIQPYSKSIYYVFI
jgi:hypothetical protein